jgi:EAL domain-containing protein (putative c-di-GMP-specific phosphodiesterase class I)/GGDEF domain-containing protein
MGVIQPVMRFLAAFPRPQGWAVGLAALAGGGGWLASAGVARAIAVAAAVGGAAIVYAIVQHLRLARLIRRLQDLAGPAAVDDSRGGAAQSIATIADRLKEVEHRTTHRHAVTGLPTREPLIERMTADACGVLGVVGITDFDRLCAFDPAMGERVLLTIVDRLLRMIPHDRLIAHVDRANIAIWFGAATDVAAALSELEVVGYALSDVVVDGDREILPEIRVRHATLPVDGANAQALLSRTLASLALPSATTAVAGVPVIDPAAVACERYDLEQDLRKAIARGELEMRYQPLIDAGEGRVSGAESLIRWFHPTRGQVPPSRFVPVMEAMGLAHEIGMWTLNAAAREARAWQAQDLGALRVAVNVSGHQLDRDDMAALVARTLARHSLTPAALEIELTESVAMSDGARAAHLFDALRATGVRIAIDDFGTGFSSFSTLRTLAFDKIKIDREFVTNVDTRRDSQAICQSIVALGRGLGIRVLAEGVERAAEYEWLLRHGCTHFQGYYFSPPLTGAAFVAFARDTDALATLLAVDPQRMRDRMTERLTA